MKVRELTKISLRGGGDLWNIFAAPRRPATGGLTGGTGGGNLAPRRSPCNTRTFPERCFGFAQHDKPLERHDAHAVVVDYEHDLAARRFADALGDG